ncbi:MAG: hypothetical protein ACLQQ4_13505 [Bacteroidia bacterium]
MPIDTIENIYSDFRANYVNEPDFIINFFEQHAIFLNNIRLFKDKEELGLFIQMISNYTNAVYQKGRYNLAIDLVDKYQIFIDEEIKRLSAEKIKDAWYYSISFVKGIASFNLKDYKTATPIFKKLVQTDNQNDNYKNWLNYSQAWQRQWIMRIISITLMTLLVLGIFFKKYIPFKIGISMDVFVILGFIIIGIYDHYIRRNVRNKKK